MRSPSSFRYTVTRSPHSGLCPSALRLASSSAEVPRVAVVVEDDLLVELAEVRHHREHFSHLRAARRPGRRLSAACCRRANEARAVAGTPKRSITGCAQWWPVRIATPSWSRIVPMSCGWTPSSTNDEDAGLLPGGADQPQPGISVQPGRRVVEQLVLGPPTASRPSAAELVDRRAEPDRARDVRRARLELVREVVVGRASRSVTERIMSPPPCQGGIASRSSCCP